MLAARAYEGERELLVEQVDDPVAGSGEVVIKVESAGLSNGLVHLWHRGLFPVLPRTLGHEAAGTIAEVGSGVSEIAVGDRVRLHPNLMCRHCKYCLNGREQFCAQASVIGHGIFGAAAMPMYKRYLNGALAEYVRVPAWTVEPMPKDMSFDVAAKIHDVADGLRAMSSVALPPGATVVVTAATGVLGTSMVRLAPLFGIQRVIAVGRSAERLMLTQGLAPDLVETVALEDLGDDWGETQALTQAIRERVPEGPDAVFDFFDSGPGTWQAIASLATGGSATLMAPNMERPPVPTVAFIRNGWRIVGTRSCTRADAQRVSDWVQQGRLRIDDLITHRFGLNDIGAATRLVAGRTEPTWMVIVHPAKAPQPPPASDRTTVVGDRS